MIITLTGANFSTSNIGTLSSWSISTVLGSGATYSGNRVVDKDAALNATVTIAEGYELGAAGVTVTMGGSAVTSGVTVNGNTIIISIAKVTGTVVIKVPTKNTATGEDDNGGNGDVVEPENPVAKHPYANGATMPSDGIITADMTVVLNHTWLNGTDTTLLDNQDESAGTTSTNYFCSYLPIDITGYTKLDITANNENAAYYQFFTTDGSYKLTGARIKVDKGTTLNEQSIPSKAKYLIVAHSRIKDDGLTYSYFPTNLKIYK